jgi:hypothetical protein
MKPDTLKALRALCDAIVETIEEFPNGAPAGPMYMAFAEHNMSLEVFEAIMSALVSAGKIRKSGHQYFPIKK